MKTKNIIDSRALELTIISAESLTLSGKRVIKKNTFVVIKTESSNNNQVTRRDIDNGSYPSWNEKFFLDMPMHVSFFTLEVRCRNSRGEHVVGSARVPVSDFTGMYFPCNYLHFLSYRLRDRYNERNGIINVSVKMKSSGLDGDVGNGASTSCSLPVTGWKNGGANVDKGLPHGVVMGVPVRV